jgi:hypothetical protein
MTDKSKAWAAREYHGERPLIQPWILERMLKSEARRQLRKLTKEYKLERRRLQSHHS